MNKTSGVRVLNGSQVASSTVLLNRRYLMHGEGNGGNPLDQKLIEGLKRLMSAIHKNLDDFIGFLTGNLNDLPKSLDNDMLENLSTAFYDLRDPALFSTVYEDYRLFITSLIPSFQNIRFQVLSCQQTETQLEKALDKASILEDINKLKEYIQGLKTKYEAIPRQEVTVPLALIKEPYNTYIRMFGFPPGMLWDPDKVGFVIEYLKVNSI